jgi:hypothetical protein
MIPSIIKAEIEKLQKIIGKQAIQIEILKNGGDPGGQDKTDRYPAERVVYGKGSM